MHCTRSTNWFEKWYQWLIEVVLQVTGEVSDGLRAEFPNTPGTKWSQHTTGTAIAVSLRMTRVLLVEDSADVLLLLQLQLQWLGYQIDAAGDADAALALAHRTPPDVIVSDLGLPGMDGFEFIQQIRKTPHLASVPAIALTGTSSPTEVQKAVGMGFSAHLTKPVEASVLAAKIEQFTSRWLQRQAS
jgi:CheY-like chemotaxis protein